MFPMSCLFILVGGKTPDPSLLKNVRTYKDIIQEMDLQKDQVWRIYFFILITAKILIIESYKGVKLLIWPIMWKLGFQWICSTDFSLNVKSEDHRKKVWLVPCQFLGELEHKEHP